MDLYIISNSLNFSKRILIKDKIIILTKSEPEFLTLFINKKFATLEEIYNKIQKNNNTLYVFLSKLKKKTGIEFENIKKWLPDKGMTCLKHLKK